MKLKSTLMYATLVLVLGLGTSKILAGSASRVTPGPVPAAHAIEFDDLCLTVELNSVPDAGVLLLADTSESLRRLRIRDPHGKLVFGLVSRDQLDLGLSEIFWETTEPDAVSVFLAYPEGEYKVVGRTHGGLTVAGVAELSHSVLAYPVVTAPVEGDELPLDDLTVEWILDPQAESYWIEFDVETEDEAFNYTIPMPSGTSEFTLPASLLLPGAFVAAGVAAVGSNGNATVTIVEVDIEP